MLGDVKLRGGEITTDEHKDNERTRTSLPHPLVNSSPPIRGTLHVCPSDLSRLGLTTPEGLVYLR